METISIPSPTVFLKKSPLLEPVPNLPQKKPVKVKTNASKPPNKPAVAATQGGAITKPKQSKSRNGTDNHYVTTEEIQVLTRSCRVYDM